MAGKVNQTNCSQSSCLPGHDISTANPWANATLVLQKLNDEKASLYIPVVLYMLILLVTGVIGNSLVLYVYLKRFKRTSSNYFIMSMAMFDMMACCIGMPTEIYDLRYPYMFYSQIACKLFRFSESVPIIGSAFILVAVAFDRYFKICKPFKNTPLFVIKRICIAIAVVAFITTIPTLFVFGVKDVQTVYPGVVGKDCSIVKIRNKSTTLSLVWFGYLTLAFVACTATMIGLYVRIWVEIKRRQRQVLGTQVSKISADDSGLPQSPTTLNADVKPAVAPVDKEPVSKVKYLPSISVSSDPDSGGVKVEAPRTHSLGRLGSNSSQGMDPEKKSLRQIGENVMTKIRASKTTVILFTVTIAFILSYLPTLVVTVIRSKDSSKERPDTVDFLMKLFSKSYFINNSINPIIYSFLNVNFRRECAKALSRLSAWCLCCCRGDSGRGTISKTG